MYSKYFLYTVNKSPTFNLLFAPCPYIYICILYLHTHTRTFPTRGWIDIVITHVGLRTPCVCSDYITMSETWAFLAWHNGCGAPFQMPFVLRQSLLGSSGGIYPLVNKDSYWKWPFIVRFPIKRWLFSIALLNYQTVRYNWSCSAWKNWPVSYRKSGKSGNSPI